MKIDVTVPDGKSGEWSVETFTVSEKQAEFEIIRSMFSFSGRGRRVPAGTYKRLMRSGTVVMSNTPNEIHDHILFICKAKNGRNILINGLGLGVSLKAILDSDKVESVTIIEKSPDVINLVAPSFLEDKRVTIICADALEWKPPKGQRYDAVWHDIWDDICSDNLPEMEKLHRRYGRKTYWQGSWGKALCARNR